MAKGITFPCSDKEAWEKAKLLVELASEHEFHMRNQAPTIFLLAATFGYLGNFRNEDVRNHRSAALLIGTAKLDENDKGHKTRLDVLFEEVEKVDRHHSCAEWYRCFKQAPRLVQQNAVVNALFVLENNEMCFCECASKPWSEHPLPHPEAVE